MNTKTQSKTKQEEVVSHTQIEVKRELALKLLEKEEITDENEAKAVLLLKDCVAHGDTDAMVVLAKCCSLERGIEQNMEYAGELFLQSERKGNKEAICFIFLRNYWSGQNHVEWFSL